MHIEVMIESVEEKDLKSLCSHLIDNQIFLSDGLGQHLFSLVVKGKTSSYHCKDAVLKKLYVAILLNQNIGWSVRVKRPYWKNDEIWVYVAPLFRGKNLGEKLFEKAYSEVENEDIEVSYHCNPKFFQKVSKKYQQDDKKIIFNY